MTDSPTPHRLADPTKPILGVVPPSAPESELAIIAAVLYEPKELDRIRGWGLLPVHFSMSAEQQIWQSILNLDEGQMDIDLPTLSFDLRNRGRLDQVGGTPFLATLMDEPVVVKLEYHVRLVIDMYRARQAIAVQQASIASLYVRQGEPVQKLLSKVESEIWEITHQQSGSSYELIGDIAERARDELSEQLRHGGLLGLTTGFHDLDEVTGGYADGHLIIVAARPGIGKTSFALSTIINITAPPRDGSLPRAVYFHSCEMPREEIALRLICMLGNVDFSRIKRGTVSREEWEKINFACAELKKRAIVIDDRPAVTVAEIRSNLRKIKREIESGRIQASALELTVIDYLQLMRGVEGEGREREVGSISEGLKNLAKLESTPIMALAQLNRQVELRGGAKSKDGSVKKRPQMSDLRESGRIEMDADMILFLYRERYYDKSADDEAEVIIGKQRSGPTLTVFMKYIEMTTTFAPKPKQYDDLSDGIVDEYDPEDPRWGS